MYVSYTVMHIPLFYASLHHWRIPQVTTFFLLPIEKITTSENGIFSIEHCKIIISLVICTSLILSIYFMIHIISAVVTIRDLVVQSFFGQQVLLYLCRSMVPRVYIYFRRNGKRLLAKKCLTWILDLIRMVFFQFTDNVKHCGK